ncbi:MAG: YchJ family metal-binding protein [Rhabdochlamydiaceae bacterium]|jgi:SEC-C motif-containing protein
MTISQDFKCPCCSGMSYQDCCRIYHQGKEAENALVLMRSRYSAYALNNVEYIMRTTHPRHPAVQNLQQWKEEILKFAMKTDFERLEVLDFQEQPDRATVVFIAYLKQDNEDMSFTERSFFSKVDGHWLYVNGDVFAGENRELKV